MEDLLSFVYEDGKILGNPEEAVKRLILAPKNDEVNNVNNMLQSILPSHEKEYLAADTPIGTKTHDPYYTAGFFLIQHFTYIKIRRSPSRSPQQVFAIIHFLF